MPFTKQSIAVLVALTLIGCTQADPLPVENHVILSLAQDTSAGNYTLHVHGTEYAALQVVSSDSHTCFIAEGKSVYCWGDNTDGQLGLGNTSPQAMPQKVPGLANVQVLALGSKHTCALDSKGDVYCWGDNTMGQIGFSSNRNEPSPVKIMGIPHSATNLVAGMSHTCARVETGELLCWGANGSGQLGDEAANANATAPTVVAGLGDTVTNNITAGYLHTCASLASGDVKCWGNNMFGQVAADVPGVIHYEPTLVALSEPIKAVSAGGYHTCAILEDDTVKCWGSNEAGQLGEPLPSEATEQSPSSPDAPQSPVASGSEDENDESESATLASTTEVSEVLTGAKYTCVLTEGEEVLCWGDVSGLQRGDSVNLALF